MKIIYTKILIIAFFIFSFTKLFGENTYFIPNYGQWNNDLIYVTKGADINIGITLNKILFYQTKSNSEIQVFQTEFINALSPIVVPKVELQTKFNFIIGNNPNYWKTNLSSYSQLQLINIYPGINLLLKFEDNKPRYDFVIQPGSNPNKIKMRITGAETINTNKNNLIINNVKTGLIHTNLKAYQTINNEEIIIPCTFKINQDEISFELGEYDRTKELIIDPVVFSDYIGGSSDDVVNGVKFYKNDYIITTGYSNSTNYPTTAGSYSTTTIGEYDIIVAKYKVTGFTRELLFATYIGGSNTDVSNSLDIDNDGDIYITGSTISADFPRINSAGFPYSGDQDAYLIKLSKNGDKILNSSIFGGTKEDVGIAVAVNPINKSTAIIGYTNSNNFPTYGSAAQTSNKGLYDAFITKVNPAGTSLVFSTYWGGSNVDKGLAIAVDIDGSIYLGGETSGNFPIFPYRTQWGQVLDKPYDDTYNGGIDGWAASMTTTGAIEFSTYFGGTADDRVTGVSYASDGTMIIIGETAKEPGVTKFPTSDNAYSKVNKGLIDGFFAHLDKIKTRTVGFGDNRKYQDLLFSTMFGGSSNDYVAGIAFNQNQEGVYIAGTTNSSNFPVFGDEIQTKIAGKYDAYVIELAIQGNDVLWSTFFGGTQDDYSLAVAVDSSKNIAVVGYTSSSDLIKPNLNFQKQFQGGQKDGFIAKFTQGTLDVTYPITNDKFCSGQPMDVKYTTTVYPMDELFRVDFRLKPGDNWQTLTSTASNGSFRWAVPNNMVYSDSAIFRIEHPSGLWQYSDFFTIMALPAVSIASISPASQIVCEGDNFTITTNVTGTNLSYKWYFENNPITDQTGKDLLLKNVTQANIGKYKVAVTGTCKPDAISNEVSLNVNPATRITTEPKDITILKGTNAVFSVVSGGLNLSYEWYRNGERILGATQSSYTIENAQKASEGRYSCVVLGTCGTDTSYAAELKVDDQTVVLSDKSQNITIELLSKTKDKNYYKITADIGDGFRLSLYGLQGQLIGNIENYSIETDGIVFGIENHILHAGIYFITFYSNQGYITKPILFLD